MNQNHEDRKIKHREFICETYWLPGCKPEDWFQDLELEKSDANKTNSEVNNHGENR